MPQSPLEPWPMDAGWVRIAWQPSRFAPTLSQVHQAQAQALVVPQTIQEWIEQYTARDLTLESGTLIGCSLTARAYLTATAHETHGVQLRRVRLIAVGPWLAELAQHQPLSQLEELDLTACRLGDESLSRLLRSPYLAGLRHLRLARNNLTGWATLTPCCHWPELAELDLTGNSLHLNQVPHLPPQLQALHLSRCGSDWSTCQALFEREDIRHLRNFTLSDRATMLSSDTTTIDLQSNGFNQLPPREFLQQVEVLLLRGNRYRAEDVETLRGWKLPRLRWCDLFSSSETVR